MKKTIKISTQKKFLILPFLNAFIIYLCTCMNAMYLKKNGMNFNWWNVKLVLNLFIRGFCIWLVNVPCILFLDQLNISQVYFTVIGVLLIYVNSLTMSIIFINYQKKLGVDEG